MREHLPFNFRWTAFAVFLVCVLLVPSFRRIIFGPGSVINTRVAIIGTGPAGNFCGFAS